MDNEIEQYLTERDGCNLKPYGTQVLHEAASRFHARNPKVKSELKPTDPIRTSCLRECTLKVCHENRVCMGAVIFVNELNVIEHLKGLADMLNDSEDKAKYTRLRKKWKSIGW